jgi:hypothetical protein
MRQDGAILKENWLPKETVLFRKSNTYNRKKLYGPVNQ